MKYFEIFLLQHYSFSFPPHLTFPSTHLILFSSSSLLPLPLFSPPLFIPIQQDCKMFIGGLHLSTEVETLKDYFSKWGSIIDAVVMTDGATKRSRGFGFVTYSSSQAVDDCLAAKPHVIDGKDVRK